MNLHLIVALIVLASLGCFALIMAAFRAQPVEDDTDEIPNGDHVQLPPGFLRHVHNGGIAQ